MKRLVVCCDGTWQKLNNPYPTNVVKFAQAVKSIASDGVPQIVFYDEGIGTEGGLNSLLGGAFGQGIDKNIQDGYRFLCLNYIKGDEIYLFGFSRGAYTVRSLAGLIYNSGLLSRPYIRLASEAYELYRDSFIKPKDSRLVQFRQEHGERVPIKLLGCWDTVGSLGIPEVSLFSVFTQKFNQRYRFHDTSLSPIIENALHAVAIDEPRKAFSVTPMTPSRHSQTQVVRQVWFPGDHGCIGGGVEEVRGLSDCALKWMIDAIGQLGLGLELEPTAIPTGIEPDPGIDLIMDIVGWITSLGGKALRELSEKFDDFDDSVIQRFQTRQDYRPPNLIEKYGDQLEEFIQTRLNLNQSQVYEGEDLQVYARYDILKEIGFEISKTEVNPQQPPRIHNHHSQPINIKILAIGEWNCGNEGQDAAFVSGDGHTEMAAEEYCHWDLTFINKEQEQNPPPAALVAFKIRGDHYEVIAWGKEQEFELQPDETVYFASNNQTQLYDNNNGIITINWSYSFVPD
ncbi:MAG: DUF2235 domain-containing protein [Cyanobacteria bacterium J06592_8]